MRTPPPDMNGIQMFIKSLQDENIVSSLPKHDVSYVSQIRMYATTQLAECWMNMQSSGNLSIISPSPN
ncbi:Hypothetical protein CINCED_3A010089 [Cinara cedri]|uniref:Uncharacterized protein n=1 Tax=Cinara cedri TaxID=506608 RepID=A0A5E4NN82_9HEMI|nr:Hypothetical protein CINCED_3A010089 [Cinara cedri]